MWITKMRLSVTGVSKTIRGMKHPPQEKTDEGHEIMLVFKIYWYLVMYSDIFNQTRIVEDGPICLWLLSPLYGIRTTLDLTIVPQS